MAKLAALVAIVACVLTAGTAGAHEATGWIIGLDPENDELTLDTGKTFVVPDDISLASLTENTCVRIRYRRVDGIRIMTGISPLTAPDAAPRQGTAKSACAAAQ